MNNIFNKILSYKKKFVYFLSLVLSLLIITALGLYVAMIILNNTRIRQIEETRNKLTYEMYMIHNNINLNNTMILQIENRYGASAKYNKQWKSLNDENDEYLRQLEIKNLMIQATNFYLPPVKLLIIDWIMIFIILVFYVLFIICLIKLYRFMLRRLRYINSDDSVSD